MRLSEKDILNKLAEKLPNEETISILCLVAHDSTTPEEVLDVLSKSKDWRVREATAGNPKIPDSVRERLSKDENLSVREALNLQDLFEIFQ